MTPHGADFQNRHRPALARQRLCRDCWQPLCTYVRRRGSDVHAEEHLTQEFFARLLEKGRFRSFLLAALNHFLSNEWDKQRRLKRGGGVTLVSLDQTREAERRLHAEVADGLTPERAFERRWALTLLERALKALEADWSAKGRAAEFAALQGFLSAMPEGDAYAQAAAQLGALAAGEKRCFRAPNTTAAPALFLTCNERVSSKVHPNQTSVE